MIWDNFGVVTRDIKISVFMYLCFYKNFKIKNFEIFTVQHIAFPKYRAADSSCRAV
jgi:hypothetical protein